MSLLIGSAGRDKKLLVISAEAALSVDIESAVFGAGYRRYMLDLMGFVPASVSPDMEMLMKINGSWVTTGTYLTIMHGTNTSSGSVNVVSTTTDVRGRCASNSSRNFGSVLVDTHERTAYYEIQDNGGTVARSSWGIVQNNTAGVFGGLRLRFSYGNVATAEIVCYGVRG